MLELIKVKTSKRASLKNGGSKLRMRIRQCSGSLTRLEIVCAVLLGGFFVALSLGPRIPLPIDVGRRVDLRIHEIIVVILTMMAVYLVIWKKTPTKLISPWSPWFLIAFVSLVATLFVKTMLAREQIFLNLGYSFRALMFFVISVSIFIVAYNCKSGLRRFTLPLMLLAFIINAIHMILNSIQGKNAFIEDLYGNAIEQYSPGLLGEPNALAAGTYFVFFIVLFAQWRSRSLTAQLFISLGVVVALVCIYMTNNRSAMIMAVVAIVIQLVSSIIRRNHWASTFYALILVSGAVSFFILNARGSSETISGALSYGRIPQWTRSVDLLKENPIFGWNLGSNEPHQAFLRLLGEFGIVTAGLFMALLAVILWRSPGIERKWNSETQGDSLKVMQVELRNDHYSLRVLKQLLAVLLVGGLVTDSLTPVQSWDLLAFSLGMAWATWHAGRPEPTSFSHTVKGEDVEVIVDGRKLLPE